ncbi:O-antigen ligase family protein [uncultured Oscillibacter sp.]|uniref:O-antigen ligase family protein n=1 Tax=uncultured Oscillibacter sp. TaxID=876091 RepID=UPI002631748E|nr:O-antigen ligase family protein [uncultured Oscillibacter sp.]
MKRRKSAAALSLSGPRWDAATVVLFSIFLFFAMHLWTERASVWLTFIALALCIGRTPWRLARERFCVPVIGFLAFMVVYGLSAIYSPFGGTAARGFAWMLAAFAVAALVLFRFERRHVRGLLWGLAAVSAVVSLLSTDMACEGPFYNVFASLMEHFGVGEVYTGIENTVGRVNGVYNDANVTGSLFALGTLVSLYLVQTGKRWWDRLLGCVLVSTSAVGILLSISRGAILCFGLSLLVWLAAAGREQRLRLFLLMVIAAGGCIAAAVFAMPMVAPGAMLPDIVSVVSGGVIFLLDWVIGERLAKLLEGHGRVMVTVTGAVIVLGGIAVVVALTVTEPYVFGESIVRSTNLSPGEYTLSAEGDFGESCRVNIYKRSDVETLLGQSTQLYLGPLERVSFTVPEDSARVFFRFSGSEGDVLQSVTLSSGEKIPLEYKFLPEEIAFRLHRGIFSDNSYLLRVQFMKDALVLFGQCPLIGHGLGASDNLYPTVQPFYYQSRYVHNHVLQIMADQGLLGTIPFVVFLGGGLWLLIKCLRKGQDTLAAVLLACWMMMNSHALMEINFSLPSYQCYAFVLLLLPVVLYGEPLSEKVIKIGGMAVCTVFWLYLTVFGGLMGLRQRVKMESNTLRATSVDELMEALDSYARRDFFDSDPYRLEYVATAVQETDGRYDVRMTYYVDKIRRSGNYPSCSALLQYYYLPSGDFRGLFECSQQILLQRTSYAEVWNGQVAFYRDEVLPAVGEKYIDIFVDGILAFQDLLAEINQDRMEVIILSEENQAFVNRVSSAMELRLSGGELYNYLIADAGDEGAS